MENLAKARVVIETEIEGLRRMSSRLDHKFVDAVRILHNTLDAKGKIVVVGYPKGTSLTPGQIVNGAGALQPGVDGYARRVVDLLEPHSPWDFVSMPNEEDLRWSLVFNMGSLP